MPTIFHSTYINFTILRLIHRATLKISSLNILQFNIIIEWEGYEGAVLMVAIFIGCV